MPSSNSKPTKKRIAGRTWRGWLISLALAAAVLFVPRYLRGPQPEKRPPAPVDTETAGRLLTVTRAFLINGSKAQALPATQGSWYVSSYPVNGGRRVTVSVAGPVGQWAEPLRGAWPGRLQVDRAIANPPPARSWLRGYDLDIGLDGWIEDDGRVHLPVSFLLARFTRPALAKFIGEHPGRPLRTYAWVKGPAGPIWMLRQSVDPGPLTPELLRRRCNLGGDYLARHLKPDNRFHYIWDAIKGHEVHDYNLLRHAGTAYSMFQLYNVTHRKNHYQAAVKSLLFLRSRLAYATGDRSRCFLVEQPSRKVKLGGAGLALVALVEQAKAHPEHAATEWMHCLANHIVSQADDTGYMESFYTDGGRYPWSDHKSSYYQGEALLGLVRLHQLEPNQRWLNTAVKTAKYLIERRWTALGLEFMVPPDAWLAQALQELYQFVPNKSYADYTFKIGMVMTRQQMRGKDVPVDLRGARIQPGFPSVVATGSRGEGLAAVAKLERQLRPGQGHFLAGLLANSHYALRNQYTAPILFGLNRPGLALGGFRSAPNDPQIRIDGVQHNISGLLGLLELLEGRR